MTFNPAFYASLQTIGWMGVKLALILGIAWLLQRCFRSAVFRRTIWQAGLLGCLGLLCFEFSGWNETSFREPNPDFNLAKAEIDSVPPLEATARFEGSITTGFREAVMERAEQNRRNQLPGPSASEASANRVSEVEIAAMILPLIWFLGTTVFLARLLIARCVFCWFWRAPARRHSELHEELDRLRGALRLTRRVRLIESPRLKVPVAFGVFRPTIALPVGFSRQFSPVQQRVILAHELAHLGAYDTAWQGMADFTAACCWWHPLVWWARRELRIATESVADEASLVVANGPGVLAECLVKLGGRLSPRPAFGWIGIAGNGTGFRSSLGQRVERLMSLRGIWAPPRRARLIAGRCAGSLLLVLTALAGAAWVQPYTFEKGEPMKSMMQRWKTAFVSLAFLSAAENNPGIGRAQQVEPEISPEAATEPGLAGGAPRAAANANPKSERGLYQMDPRMLARYFPQFKGQLTQPAPSPSSAAAAAKVQSKLESIVLEEIPIEGLPLQEVLKVLARESRSRDPEKHGINYLISNVSEIDPAVTGLSGPNPAAAGASLNDLTIHFNLPLRNVRLKDVLDAIVRVAERPIKYSVHDFGVLFSPGPFYSAAGVGDPALGAPMLQVRTFRVDPGTFVASLETAFGIKISVPAPARGEEAALPRAAQLRLKHAEEDLKTATKLFETGNIGSDEFTRAKQRVEMLRAELDDLKEDLKKRGVARPQVPSREVQKALRQLLVDLGVNMDVANKAVYYNDLTGMVMVRASVEDLELVQAAIETLGGTASAPGMPYGLPGGGVGRLPGMGTSDPGGAAGDFPGTGSKNGGYGGLGESSDESTAGISSQLPLSRTVRGTGERTDAVIVLGQVSNPCRIELPSSVQWGVLDAIAEAGGFTKLAHTSRIEVTRKGSAQKFDLETLKVANDSTNKFILQSGDIVFVPERSF